MVIKREWLPAYAIFCALLWGSAFPGIKAAYALWPSAMSTDDRLLFAGVRFMIAGLMIVPFVRGAGGLRAQLRRANFPLLLGLTLTQTFGQYVLFYLGLALASGVLSALINSTGSFWWMLLSPLLLKTPRPNLRHWLIVVASSIGIAIAVWKPGSGGVSPVAGAVCLLAASLCGALGLVMLRPLHQTLDTATATALSLFSGGLLLSLCGLSAGPETFTAFTDVRIAGLTLYLAFVSAAAFVLWNRMAREFSVNLLAGYRFLIPLAGIILSALLIPGESPGLGIYAGGAIVLGSLLYLNAVDRRSRRLEEARPPARAAAP